MSADFPTPEAPSIATLCAWGGGPVAFTTSTSSPLCRAAVTAAAAAPLTQDGRRDALRRNGRGGFFGNIKLFHSTLTVSWTMPRSSWRSPPRNSSSKTNSWSGCGAQRWKKDKMRYGVRVNRSAKAGDEKEFFGLSHGTKRTGGRGPESFPHFILWPPSFLPSFWAFFFFPLRRRTPNRGGAVQVWGTFGSKPRTP